MKVFWTPMADHDLEEIGDYVSFDSPDSALFLLQQLRASAEKLNRFPEIGRTGRIDGTRELVVPGTPYFIVYAILDDAVHVFGVIHGARQWPD